MRFRISMVLWFPLFLGALDGCAGWTGNRQTAESPLQRALTTRADAVDRARISLRAAKDAGCEYAAPYEYHMAREYLDLAVHELNGGDREGVVEFAEKSNVHAVKAIEMVKGESK